MIKHQCPLSAQFFKRTKSLNNTELHFNTVRNCVFMALTIYIEIFYLTFYICTKTNSQHQGYY